MCALNTLLKPLARSTCPPAVCLVVCLSLSLSLCLSLAHCLCLSCADAWENASLSYAYSDPWLCLDLDMHVHICQSVFRPAWLARLAVLLSICRFFHVIETHAGRLYVVFLRTASLVFYIHAPLSSAPLVLRSADLLPARDNVLLSCSM